MHFIFLLLFSFVSIIGIAKTNPPQDTLDVMIGQMIMVGIGDFNLVDSDQSIFKEIKEGKVGGVVLYEKNILLEHPKSALALLIQTLQKNSSIPLFVSIDEEGGWVSRMTPRYGFPNNVSAQYLGELNNLDSTRYYANQTASLLNSFGINMNYAPVVDINLNPKNPVIGKIQRSYSPAYTQVIRHANVVIDEHQKKNVIPVLKHFPGHGSSKSDTHLGLTDVTQTWQLEEIYPYRAFIDSGKVSAIMTAHIVNKSLDQTKTPSTLSKPVVTGLLRDFLGYDGIIISDDMQMGAINNEYGLRQAVTMAIQAGVDILMFANNVSGQNRASATTIHRLIKNLVLDGIISEERIKSSYDRIMKLKMKTGLCDQDYYQVLKNKLRAYH